MSQPVLFIYPGDERVPSLSPPCAKVVLALAWSQLPHTVKRVKGNPSVSPTGRLPALQLGAEVICDSVAILDRLEQLELPRPISPTEPQARAQDRLWEHYVNDTIYWPGLYLRWFPKDNRRRLLNFILGERFSFKRILLGRVIVREVQRRAKGQGVGLKSEDQVRAILARGLELMDAALPEEGFLAGETPGRGDFAVAALTCQGEFQGLTPKVAEQVATHPKLLAHMRRVFEACSLPVPGES